MKKDLLHSRSRSVKDKAVNSTNEFPRARRLEKKWRVRKIRAGNERGDGDGQDMSAQGDDTQDDLRAHLGSRATSRDEPFTEN